MASRLMNRMDEQIFGSRKKVLAQEKQSTHFVRHKQMLVNSTTDNMFEHHI